MDKQISEMDKRLQNAPEGSLFIAIEKNKGKRNICLFLGIITVVVVLLFSWIRWLLLFPAILGVGAILYHMNIVIVSSELKRRSNQE